MSAEVPIKICKLRYSIVPETTVLVCLVEREVVNERSNTMSRNSRAVIISASTPSYSATDLRRSFPCRGVTRLGRNFVKLASICQARREDGSSGRQDA